MIGGYSPAIPIPIPIIECPDDWDIAKCRPTARINNTHRIMISQDNIPPPCSELPVLLPSELKKGFVFIRVVSYILTLYFFSLCLSLSFFLSREERGTRKKAKENAFVYR